MQASPWIGLKLRIIGGEFRGRRLATPEGLVTRPMLARVREALFNILSTRIVGARVADCFSGTGAIGLEALSRGAEHVDFFESGRHVLSHLERNIAQVGVGDRVTLHRSKLPASLGVGPPWDVVIVDQPWTLSLGQPLVAHLLDRGRVTSEGWIVVSERKGFELDDRAWHELDLEVVDRRRYGDSSLVFLAKSV